MQNTKSFIKQETDDIYHKYNTKESKKILYTHRISLGIMGNLSYFGEKEIIAD